MIWDFHSEDLEDGWQGAFNRSFSCRAKGKCVVQLVSDAYLEQSRNLSTLATSVSRARSVPTGPLNTLQTVFGSWMGNRMTPSNSTESIS